MDGANLHNPMVSSMRNRTESFSFAWRLLAAAALLASATAVRAQSLTLAWRPYAGMTYKITDASNINLSLNITANGQQQQPVSEQFATQRSGTVTVMSVDNGAASAVQVAFDQNCADSQTSSMGQNAGQPQTKPFPFAGESPIVRRNPDGTFALDYHGQATPDADAVAELRAVIDPDLGRYPTQPVSVGQQWQGGRDSMAHALNFTQQDDGTMNCTLSDVENYNGKQAARVAVDMNATTTKGPMKLQLHLTGTILYDIATGLPMKTDLGGDITASMQGQQTGANGQPVTIVVNGAGKAQLAFTADQTDSGAGGAPPMGGGMQPGGMQPGGMQPGGIDGMMPANNNPPAPPAGGGTAAFNGTFSNDKMSLTLAEQSDGSYTGTLQTQSANGPQSFPVQATIGATGMVGKFFANNTGFDFTASLTPDNQLIFTTTGSGGIMHFTLSKQAPPAGGNPLDQGAAPAQPAQPRNPLGQ
jgi:hypothetical protein